MRSLISRLTWCHVSRLRLGRKSAILKRISVAKIHQTQIVSPWYSSPNHNRSHSSCLEQNNSTNNGKQSEAEYSGPSLILSIVDPSVTEVQSWICSVLVKAGIQFSVLTLETEADIESTSSQGPYGCLSHHTVFQSWQRFHFLSFSFILAWNQTCLEDCSTWYTDRWGRDSRLLELDELSRRARAWIQCWLRSLFDRQRVINIT